MQAPRALALCYNFGGALDFQEGRWREAEANLRRAVDTYREVGSAAGESLSLQRLGVLLTAVGKIDEAYNVLAEGLVVAERAAMRSHCLTRLHASVIRNRLAAGDGDGIASSLAEGLEAARRHGNCVTCNALLMPEVVRAQLELGEIEAAEESCKRLQDISTEFDSHVWTAMAAQCAGRVRLAQERYDEAFEHLEVAKSGYQAADQPYEAARCLVLQGECLRDTDAARAEGLEAAGRGIFTALGAAGIE
jgi:tetratricopeptide (TPR) repeat protein